MQNMQGLGSESLHKVNKCSRVFVALMVALTLSACDQKGGDAGAGAASQMPPPQVGYISVSAQTVGMQTELPGRLEASRVADVRARVAGIIERQMFVEGSEVKANQQLFQIDDAPYRAALQSARAQLAQAEASLMQTRSQAQRYRPLVEVNAISRQDYDNAVSAQRASEANVAAARAAITTAQINLGYAAVRSPIDGRIGRALVTEGALVGQGSATELAVVQQIDPLYVNFTQSAADAIRLRATGAHGSIPVTVVFDDGKVYEHQGTLIFTDLSVDETTGQVTLRATLPNPNNLLLPGLYVRVRLEQTQVSGAYLVPQQAITRASSGDSLYVINAQNIVEPRQITISGRNGQNWIVSNGLQDGDRVMVNGFQGWQMAMQMARQAHAASGQQGAPMIPVTPVLVDASGTAQPGQGDQGSGQAQPAAQGEQNAPALTQSQESSSN